MCINNRSVTDLLYLWVPTCMSQLFRFFCFGFVLFFFVLVTVIFGIFFKVVNSFLQFCRRRNWYTFRPRASTIDRSYYKALGRTNSEVGIFGDIWTVIKELTSLLDYKIHKLLDICCVYQAVNWSNIQHV